MDTIKLHRVQVQEVIDGARCLSEYCFYNMVCKYCPLESMLLSNERGVFLIGLDTITFLSEEKEN